jgi:hypothetical protein
MRLMSMFNPKTRVQFGLDEYSNTPPPQPNFSSTSTSTSTNAEREAPGEG